MGHIPCPHASRHCGHGRSPIRLARKCPRAGGGPSPNRVEKLVPKNPWGNFGPALEPALSGARRNCAESVDAETTDETRRSVGCAVSCPPSGTRSIVTTTPRRFGCRPTSAGAGVLRHDGQVAAGGARGDGPRRPGHDGAAKPLFHAGRPPASTPRPRLPTNGPSGGRAAGTWRGIAPVMARDGRESVLATRQPVRQVRRSCPEAMPQRPADRLHGPFSATADNGPAWPMPAGAEHGESASEQQNRKTCGAREAQARQKTACRPSEVFDPRLV